MGHVIDPLGYDKVIELHREYAEQQYLKAERHLSLSERAGPSREEARTTVIEALMGRLSDADLRPVSENRVSTFSTSEP